jgi:hypothetical protein
MARYDGGYDRPLRPGAGDWSTPYGPRGGMRYDRQGAGERPWVGGYRDGYQGGSSGTPVGRRPNASRGAYGGQGAGSRGRGGRYGGDYWWLGERAYPDRYARYDEGYGRFDRENRPRYSPVGGTYPAMGGEATHRRPPGPLREESWFSDWTRWF